MSNNKLKNTVGLYIHVPFCVTKCNYCKFYSVEYSRFEAKLWKDKIVHELKRYEQSGQFEHLEFDTVFFGGGTPSLLYNEIDEIVSILLHTSPYAEITVEVNPDDVSLEMMKKLDYACTRISIGVQSLDDSLLRTLGRRHDSAQAIKAVKLAREVGFEDISVDIMIGIPGQTMDSLVNTIKILKKLPMINHVSAYIYEGENNLSEDEIAKMYLKTVKLLNAYGLKQYEISNFGKPCRHNLKYWRGESYIGIGPTAHSYYGGKRFAVSETWETYITEENPNIEEERIMLGLRLTEGIHADKSLIERAKTIPSEYIHINKENLSLTPKGFLIANRIIGDLLN